MDLWSCDRVSVGWCSVPVFLEVSASLCVCVCVCVCYRKEYETFYALMVVGVCCYYFCLCYFRVGMCVSSVGIFVDTYLL